MCVSIRWMLKSIVFVRHVIFGRLLMTRIYCRIKSLSKDTTTMANSLMKKAVTYMLNQWESLRNFILDGRVQLSNNLCE